MRNTHLVLALVGIIGCNGKDEDSSASMDFEPSAGIWNWANASYALDDCSLESTFPPAIIEALEWDLTTQDGGFTVEQAAFSTLNCTLDGMNFSCPVTLETEVAEWPEGSGQTGDPDVVTSTAGSVSGTFIDASTATAAFAFTVTCSGADCDAYGVAAGATSPCDSRVEGDFVLNEG